METLEQLIERLKTFQIERGKLKNRLNSVDRTIKDTAYKIDKLTEKSLRINPAIVLKNRDISICLSFIKENRRVTSKQLIDHLNNQLIDKDKRWKTVLDSNLFMTTMGNYLKPYTINYNSSTDGVGGKRTTVWEHKLNN